MLFETDRFDRCPGVIDIAAIRHAGMVDNA